MFAVITESARGDEYLHFITQIEDDALIFARELENKWEHCKIVELTTIKPPRPINITSW